MISLFGSVCLIGAVISSFFQCALPLYGYYFNKRYASLSARTLTIATSLFVLGAYLLLTIAFINSDFSVRYVALHSHTALPFLYRLTALWGAHEGSMLLWIAVLQIWSLIYIGV